MATKPTKSRGISVYSNLTRRRRTKKDAEARKKAEYLASLPKHPVKRLLYRLHPKRFWGYWFSKKGGLMALKILGVGILLAVLSVGALFATIGNKYIVESTLPESTSFTLVDSLHGLTLVFILLTVLATTISLKIGIDNKKYSAAKFDIVVRQVLFSVYVALNIYLIWDAKYG